jgi:alpha-L-rhamnosidase
MNRHWTAHWIWTADSDRRPRHQAVVARRTFSLNDVAQATLRISADSHYRLWINGAWVADGPGRSWPAHHRYDVLDVARWLVCGRNVIAVEALHYGFATMQAIPQEAGLLVQLDAVDDAGSVTTIASDRTWRIRELAGWRRDSARIGIQMEAVEWRDLRCDPEDLVSLACCDLDWPSATDWHGAETGPWGDLQPRDVAMEIRQPRAPVALVEAQTVGHAGLTATFDLKAMCYAHDRGSNFARMIGVVATLIAVPAATTLHLAAPLPGGWTLHLRGRPVVGDRLDLVAGDNLLAIAVASEGHAFDGTLALDLAVRLRRPWGRGAGPWLWLGPLAPQAEPIDNATHTTRTSLPAEALAEVARLVAAQDAAALRASLPAGLPVGDPVVRSDPWVDFRSRKPLAALDRPDCAALTGTGAGTVQLAKAGSAGDREYCFDLGAVSIGYLDLDCSAPAGTVLDLVLTEHRFSDGRPQHTEGCRNGLRLVCAAGRTRYTARRRRGGRFLYLTVRGTRAALQIHAVGLIEARYPTVTSGAFACSDLHLTAIWALGARTLQLCMEDTYTDCPLYEQVLWVGDLRHEARSAHDAFASYDLTLRSLRLAAETLDHLPLPGSQVPSSWNVLLPAWSLLWVEAVDDYARHSGDRSGVVGLWPAVERTLRHAVSCCRAPDGLMSIQAWNFLDWTGIDTDSDTVLHNSLLLVGALAAFQRTAGWLGRRMAWAATAERALRAAVQRVWDPSLGGWPDALHANGRASPSTCQHTAAFGLTYDLLPNAKAKALALRALLAPPAGMATVGSPFALQFVIEALLAAGRTSEAVAIIRDRWGPMVEAGATTCWETFPGWEKDKPTRSHCHGWSAGPVHLLLETILGVQPAAYGWTKAVISPHPVNGLTHAEGAVATPHGPLRVAWKRTGTTLDVTVAAPAGMTWTVAPNPDWRGIRTVVVNGRRRP